MPVIYKKINRVEEKILKGFSKIPASIASDCMNRTNSMGASIKPMMQDVHMLGSAVTVKCIPGDNIMTHRALYLAEKGDVLVIDAGGYPDKSVWGGIQTEIAKKRGLSGVVIDGSIRDADVVRHLRYPVFCSGVVPGGPHKGFGDSINIPIQCGGVVVMPGDVLIGDDDGVVVVPKRQAAFILEKSLERLKLEEKWKREIRTGKTSMEVIGLGRKLLDMGIKEFDKAFDD